MLQDLYPHIYHNEMAWKAPAPDDYALIFAPDGTVYCDLTDGALTLPRIRDVGPGEAQYAFSIDEAAYYLVAAHPDETDAFRYVPAASLRSMTERTSPALFAAAAGGSLHRWYRLQQFCGRCGAKMEKSTTERAMVCPQCKNTVYPKICPAVIVAVHDGDRLLLTRYRGRPFKKYALIAGFNEIGETIEQTVHREVLEETGPWPFHLLTEDIQFSVDQVTRGRKIAFCPDAVLYDEQPTTFRQSWNQRLRWSKGYLQVFRGYGARLLRGAARGSFSCYDMAAAIMPAFVLSATAIVCNVTAAILGAVHGEDLTIALWSVGQMLLNMYLTLFVLGAITTVTEWKRIHTKAVKKVLYAFTFPLFMFTYIPISFAALFSKGEWKPIEHRVSAASLRGRGREELLPF